MEMIKMIKSLIFIFILILGLLANPILDKDIRINEFLIFNDSTWTLEIYFYDLFDGYIDSAEYHSITLSSSFGKSTVNTQIIKDSLQYLLITPDSLTSPLKINHKGDTLDLRTFDVYGNQTYHSTLRFGDGPNCWVNAPKPGQSICYVHEGFSDFYCLDNSPTMGYENDSIGINAKIKGRALDKNDNLISNAELFIYDHYFTSNSLGLYQADLFSHKYIITYILMRTDSSINYYSYPIDTLFLNLVPDTTVEQDIHFYTYTSLEDQHAKIPNTINIYNYPNPFNSGTSFMIDAPRNKNLNNAKIEIYNLNGELLHVLNLKGEKNIYWDGRNSRGIMQPSGKYFYRLIVNGNILKNGSTILLR